jgi:hypothetical protein
MEGEGERTDVVEGECERTAVIELVARSKKLVASS